MLEEIRWSDFAVLIWSNR